jgi:predicted nucleic acid-binding protein
MAGSTLFVDTWGWVTLSSRRETRHQEVRAFLKGFRGQVYSSDYVLDETITLLYARYPHQAEGAVREILTLIAQGSIILERITEDRFAAAWQLRQRYADKPAISFTDLTSMVVMQERGITQILTQDAHFLHVGLGLRRVLEFTA